MGDNKIHAGFTAVSENGKRVDCIIFQKAQEKKKLLTDNVPVDIIGTISEKTWMGNTRVQFVVEEIM
ncbi:MAG: hypothetical protein ACLVJQ_02715 [Lentihominibacter sp.]